MVRQLYFEGLSTRLNNATEKGKSRRAAYSTFFNSQLRSACVAEEFDVPAGREPETQLLCGGGEPFRARGEIGRRHARQ